MSAPQEQRLEEENRRLRQQVETLRLQRDAFAAQTQALQSQTDALQIRVASANVRRAQKAPAPARFSRYSAALDRSQNRWLEREARGISRYPMFRRRADNSRAARQLGLWPPARSVALTP